MYKLCNKLVSNVVYEEVLIPLKVVDASINKFIAIDDVFVGTLNGRFIAFDKVCDHNGGQLMLDVDGLSATCPIHKWKLRLNEGLYENGCSKKELSTRVEKDNLIVVKSRRVFPDIRTENLTESDIKFSFNAHASVSFEIDGVQFVTDPWLIGSCFANGWWHAFPPSCEAIERLECADYLYISHNHPDHLHIPTLERYVKKSTLILVPNFESKSVENILRRHGFHNLIICDFMQLVHIETTGGGVGLVIIKSGDDRDDSSLLVCTANKKVFFGVDTNMPNSWVLPKVDLLFTQFASGASGFPARIENFELSKKIEITTANRLSVFNNYVYKLVEATKPNFVIPYAGYFMEIDRDIEVRSINVKNTPDDLIAYVESRFPGVKGINPIDSPHFTLSDEGLRAIDLTETPSYFVDEDYVSTVISESLKRGGDLTPEEILVAGERFLSSSFVDNLTIVIIPCDNQIMKDYGFALVVDFSSRNRHARLLSLNGESDLELMAIINEKLNNLELLRVRSESLALVLRGGFPLEDLSIGFQIKMFRKPNVYNFKFWDHFTNREFISVQK
jgi:CMP-N-acetylneuraminate monooxygenase